LVVDLIRIVARVDPGSRRRDVVRRCCRRKNLRQQWIRIKGDRREQVIELVWSQGRLFRILGRRSHGWLLKKILPVGLKSSCCQDDRLNGE
jgi:hypothetical protein